MANLTRSLATAVTARGGRANRVASLTTRDASLRTTVPARWRYIRVPESVLYDAPAIGPYGLAIYVKLANCAFDGVTPKIKEETIARDLGISVATVRRYAGKLKRRGHIDTEGPKTGDTLSYVLCALVIRTGKPLTESALIQKDRSQNFGNRSRSSEKPLTKSAGSNSVSILSLEQGQKSMDDEYVQRHSSYVDAVPVEKFPERGASPVLTLERKDIDEVRFQELFGRFAPRGHDGKP